MIKNILIRFFFKLKNIYFRKLFKENPKNLIKEMENHYQDKFTEYLKNIHNIMFIFEVTKLCGYSTFITVYKNQTLIDLYSNIISHFGNIQIEQLFFISQEGEKIHIPMSKQTVSEFISIHVTSNPIKLKPVYELPTPVIYRIILKDNSNCNEIQCSTVHYMNR